MMLRAHAMALLALLPWFPLVSPRAYAAPRPPPVSVKVSAPAKRLRFSCPDALADGTLVDPRQADSLAALTAALKWDDGDRFGRPVDCHRRVRLFCGPDLDGDGDPEAIVEVSWWFTDSCTAEPQEGETLIVAKTFVASKHGSTWRGVAPLGAGVADDPAGESVAGRTSGGGAVAPSFRRSFFVRRRRGETAIRVEWSNAASDTGCALGGYEVFALRAGILRRVEAGDSSRLCTPCGCDDP